MPSAPPIPWTDEDVRLNPEDNPQKYDEMLNRIEEVHGRDYHARNTDLHLFLAERSIHRINTGGSRSVSAADPVMRRILENRTRF